MGGGYRGWEGLLKNNISLYMSKSVRLERN